MPRFLKQHVIMINHPGAKDIHGKRAGLKIKLEYRRELLHDKELNNMMDRIMNYTMKEYTKFHTLKRRTNA